MSTHKKKSETQLNEEIYEALESNLKPIIKKLYLKLLSAKEILTKSLVYVKNLNNYFNT